MILVDTSVLIDFFKGSGTEESQKFEEILKRRIPFGINSHIMQEILQGAASEKEFELLKNYLSTQRFYHPKDPVESYINAAKIYMDCRKQGITIRSTIDCLIGDSGPNRPPIPIQIGHLFRSKSAGHSGSNRPPL
jgi:predicted nucleic acid-binding protein